jgi:hypothetical protein
MVVLICFGLKERKEQASSTSYAVRSIGLPPSIYDEIKHPNGMRQHNRACEH